jgi:phosphatidate cytidylyltransferase
MVRSAAGPAEAMADGAAQGHRRSELALRLVSALVLIPLALFLVYQGGWWLSVGAAVFAAVMGFEWCRMAGQGPAWLGCAGLAGVNLLFGSFDAATTSLALIGFAFVFGLLHTRQFALAAFGLMYAGGLPFALQVLREGGPWEGQAAALILMAIVWASDSGAYFAGRGFGGPALSADSPNKTWSGAAGAIVCSVLSGAIAAGLLEANLLAWLAFGAALSIVAQLGDLFESQIKRKFGVKDASGLVPGHGGVMDRVDGLGAVCVFAVTAFLALPGLVSVLGF